jgi:cellulose synthase (UDP-forming)
MSAALHDRMASEAARETELTPYKFHVSEDIYTSIVLHADPDRRWRSVYHPEVLSKMLSPQDLLTWTIQRFKYAGGTLDIARNDSPFKRKGLSSWQKLAYGASIYSYLAPLWTLVFLVAPIIYFFTGASPVRAYSADFYAHFIPFLVINKLAFVVGTWGVPSWRGEQYYLAFFWTNLKAMRDVLLKRPIKFHVTPKTRQAGNFLTLVRPHLVIIGLTVAGMIWMGVRVFVFHTGDLAAYTANMFWSINNLLSLVVMVQAAVHRAPAEDS